MTGLSSRVLKRSLRIAGHATSISLEEPFWRLLQNIAQSRRITVAALVEEIDRARQGANLSSAVRVHILEWMMREATLTLADKGQGLGVRSSGGAEGDGDD